MGVMEVANINSISKKITKTSIRTNIKVRILVILEGLFLMLQLNKWAIIIIISIIMGAIKVVTKVKVMEDIKVQTK